jgi:hypothetical protein
LPEAGLRALIEKHPPRIDFMNDSSVPAGILGQAGAETENFHFSAGVSGPSLIHIYG